MDHLVTLLKHAALFLLALLMAVAGIYFSWTATIIFFKLTGRLTDGVMFHDEMTTPGYTEALLALALSAVVISICVMVRNRIRRGMAPRGGI